jgi:hypothetical protein
MSCERLVVVDGPTSVARVTEVDTSKLVYIRMGHPPATGRSQNGDDGTCEAGVSVYRAYQNGDRYLIDARNLDRESTCEIAFSHSPMFLAQGPVVGRGSDGEPVMWGPDLRFIPLGQDAFSVILANAH